MRQDYLIIRQPRYWRGGDRRSRRHFAIGLDRHRTQGGGLRVGVQGLCRRRARHRGFARAVARCISAPAFADVDPQTMNTDPARLEAAIGLRTKTVIPVHFAGRPCAMDDLLVDRLKTTALHGMNRDDWKRYSDEGYKHYQVEWPGFKYNNMTDLQASLGLHRCVKRTPTRSAARRYRCASGAIHSMVGETGKAGEAVWSRAG